MIPQSVSDSIRRRRVQLGLKQAEIARRVGVTRAYISAIERGADWNPDSEKLILIARALEWPDDYLLRRLGRVTPERDVVLSPEVIAAIQEAIAEGVRQGLREIGARLGNERRSSAHPRPRA